jgi:hypothetical protein
MSTNLSNTPTALYHLPRAHRSLNNKTRQNQTKMNNEQDVLNEIQKTDLTTVQTTMPVLKAGLYEGTVAEAKVEKNKKDTGSNLNIKISLAHATTDENGKAVNAGFPVFDTISLVRTFQADGTTVKYEPMTKVAAFAKGLGVSSIMPVESLVGKPITFRVKIEDDVQYGRKNRIERYVAQS